MLNPGQLIDGRYRILRQLGKGGMGAVYEAENQRILRRVAIKVLHSDLSQDAAKVERFEREAQAAGRIGNRHIVEVLDLGSLPTGERYLVMELLHGTTLGDYLKQQGLLSEQVAVRVAVQVLSALAAAHAAGIIHRDLKPDNLFLVEAGDDFLVKLLDFGISKFSEIAEDTGVTLSGSVIGTPQYMAPEQARGLADIDQRADVYAAGVVMYQMLCGRRPFAGKSVNELIIKVATEQPPSLSEWAPKLSKGLTRIVNRAIANDRDARYFTAQSFLAAIEQWQNRGGAPDATRSSSSSDEPSTSEQLPSPLSAGGDVAGANAWMAASAPTITGPELELLQQSSATHTKTLPSALSPRSRRKGRLLLAGATAVILSGFAADGLWPEPSTAADKPAVLVRAMRTARPIASVVDESSPTAANNASAAPAPSAGAATALDAAPVASAAITQSPPVAQPPTTKPAPEKATASKTSSTPRKRVNSRRRSAVALRTSTATQHNTIRRDIDLDLDL